MLDNFTPKLAATRRLKATHMRSICTFNAPSMEAGCCWLICRCRRTLPWPNFYKVVCVCRLWFNGRVEFTPGKTLEHSIHASNRIPPTQQHTQRTPDRPMVRPPTRALLLTLHGESMSKLFYKIAKLIIIENCKQQVKTVGLLVQTATAALAPPPELARGKPVSGRIWKTVQLKRFV